MLDGPYENDTWKGKKLYTFDVKAEKPGAYSVYSQRLPEVEGLTGKHAIYFVVEGQAMVERRIDKAMNA